MNGVILYISSPSNASKLSVILQFITMMPISATSVRADSCVLGYLCAHMCASVRRPEDILKCHALGAVYFSVVLTLLCF